MIRISGGARASFCSVAVVITACAGQDNAPSDTPTDTDVFGHYAGSFIDNADTLKKTAVYSYSDDAALRVHLYETVQAQRAYVQLTGWVRFSIARVEDESETVDIEIADDGTFSIFYKVKFSASFPDSESLLVDSELLGSLLLERED